MEDLKALIEKLERNRKILGSYYEPFYLLVKNGLRVSELLKITSKDIKESGFIVIHGSKGSSSRLISISENIDYWLKFKRLNIDMSSIISRFQVRRWFIKLGINEVKEGNKNSSQTSLPRNQFIAMLNQTDISETDKSRITGHKNVKNLGYYGRNSKKANRN